MLSKANQRRNGLYARMAKSLYLEQTFFMRRQKAIQSLAKQKERLTNNFHKNRNWVTQTHDYLIAVLPKSSFVMVEFIQAKSEFMRHLDIVGFTDNDIKELKERFSNSLVSAMQYVEDFGTIKKEWKHVLITTHPNIAWLAFVGLLTVAFFFGKCTANKSNSTAHYQAAKKYNSLQKIMQKPVLIYSSI